MSAALRPVGPRAGVDYPTSLPVPRLVRKRCRLRALLGTASLAGRVLLPEVRPRQVVAVEAPRLRLCCLRAADLADGGNDLRRHALAAADVVPRGVDGTEQQEWRESEGVAARAGDRLRRRVAAVAEAAAGDGQTGRDQDTLSGDIEVDESYLGSPTPGGKRGRGAEGKVIHRHSRRA
jgi:hypothetical protein